ncbi:unnamed protein product [Parascedosporium putredinis]|uniref:Uncharacterized protein n=1 Tax=Parascedosporium putredinis TaxID=1442378 RepID=A0A9P1HD75_9PEZI|nr:unnamed protein product [Parascedosporium putredinis]CAI8004033.1 unnamed protein product [Parascedosporium putredinis]
MISKDSLPTGFGALHSRYRFQTSADDYCDNMKNKLNPIKTFDRSPTSCFGPQDSSAGRLSPESRLPPLSVPVSLPYRTSILEEPERFTQTPFTLPFRLDSALSLQTVEIPDPRVGTLIQITRPDADGREGQTALPSAMNPQPPLGAATNYTAPTRKSPKRQACAGFTLTSPRNIMLLD